MRMRIDEVALEVPDGLEDRSNYVHRGEGPREEVGVELELPVGAATPAEQVIADQRESMAGFFGAAFGVEAEGETTLAGFPARYLRYFLIDEGERKYGKTVVANVGSGDYVRINWKGEVDGAEVDARVEPIIRSFRAHDSEAPAGPGRTHQAGPWIYELDERMSTPRTRLWTDGKYLRVELQAPPRGAPATLEAAVARLLAPGRELVDRQDAELDDGAEARVHMRDVHGREWASVVTVRRLEADAGAHELTISGTALRADQPRLARIVETLRASLTLADTTTAGESP